MAEAAPQLEYAPPLPLRRRRGFRRALLGAALLVLLACCWVMLPRYWRNAQAASQHRQWMRYTRPPTRIAFEPAGAKAQEVWQSGAGYSMRPGYVFHDTGLGGEFNDVLFLHGRRRPDGQQRLVWISLGYLSTEPLKIRLEADALVPATIARPGWRVANVYADPLPEDAAGRPPRIYAGQPDVKDESHFTMKYEFADGTGGVIHGWLRDDDSIDFEARKGSPDHAKSK